MYFTLNSRLSSCKLYTFEAGAGNNCLCLRMKCVIGLVMFHNISCHSLQCACLSVFKVAIIAVFNSSLLQLLSTPRVMTLT